MLQLRLLGGFDLILDDGSRAESVLAQPKRAALLAYLALAQPRGFHRRDTLLPLFWPEADEKHARRALNQALHHLRAGLDPTLIVARGTEDVGLDPARYRCDAADLRDALAAGRLEDALAMHRGELLPGFHVQASNELDEWLDRERRGLQDAVARAAGALSAQAAAAEDNGAAVHWARRACELAPLDEAYAQALFRALVHAGNEAGARAEFARFAERLRRELDEEPSAQTKACLLPAGGVVARVEPKPSPETSREIRAAPHHRTARWRRAGALTIPFALMSAVLFVASSRAHTPELPIHARGPAARPVVLIGDIVDPESDTLLGDVATQLFVSALQDSRSVHVVWSGELADALSRMQRQPTTPVRGTVARELAQREGFGAVLEGSLRNVSGELLLTVTLEEPSSRRALLTRAASIRDAGALTATIDRIARTVRRLIGDSAQAIARARPLEHVTTPSLEALRLYTEGAHLLRYEETRGIALLERAVSIDTGFATAYHALGVMLWWQEQPERSSNMLLAAMRHADRMTETERELTEATLYARGRYYDYDRALAAFESILERDSVNLTAIGNEIWLLDERREYAREAALEERALLASDSTRPLMFGMLADFRWNLGDSAAARRAAEEGVRRSHAPELMWVRSWVYAAEGRMDSAEAVLTRALEVSRPSDRARVTVAIAAMQAGNARRRGHLAEARRFDDKGAAAARVLRNPRMEFAARVPAVEEALRLRGDHADAAARLAELQRAANGIAYPDRPVYDLASLYADAGRPAVAADLLSDADRHFPPGEWGQLASDAHRARAHVALADGRYADAVRELRQGEYRHCATCVLPLLSVAYERAGMLDSAIAVGERALTRPDLRSIITAGIDVPELHRRLAAMYADRGDLTRAERHLSAFIALWENADPELRPQVDAARRKREELRRRLYARR